MSDNERWFVWRVPVADADGVRLLVPGDYNTTSYPFEDDFTFMYPTEREAVDGIMDLCDAETVDELGAWAKDLVLVRMELHRLAPIADVVARNPAGTTLLDRLTALPDGTHVRAKVSFGHNSTFPPFECQGEISRATAGGDLLLTIDRGFPIHAYYDILDLEVLA
jgi:hypothetical protein